MKREEIVRQAIKEVGPASRKDVEAALDEIDREREKKPPARLSRTLDSFEATLKKVRVKLKTLPKNLRLVLSEYGLNEENCAYWLVVSNNYPRPGAPKPDAWRQRLAAVWARRLLVRHNRLARAPQISRLAAILYGDKDAHLERYERELRGQLEVPRHDDIDVFFSPTISTSKPSHE